MTDEKIKEMVMDFIESEKLYSLSSMEFMEKVLKEKFLPSHYWTFKKFDILEYKIRDLLKNGATIIKLSENLRKIELSKNVFYWFECNETMTTGAEFYKSNEGLITIQIQENDNFHKFSLEDFYIQILNDCKTKIYSIDIMENEDFQAWRKLFSNHKIAVGDGTNLTNLSKLSDLDNYYRVDNSEFKEFRYILCY